MNDANRFVVLNAIYDIEESQTSLSNFDFIPASQIVKKVYPATIESIMPTLYKLQQDRLILLINSEDTCLDPDTREKIFVRSRIGHILWCLRNLKNVRDYHTEDWDDDVTDLKYIKFLKHEPRRVIKFRKIREDPQLNDIIKINELDKKTGGLFSSIVSFLNTRIVLSQFQYDSLKGIILGLANENRKDADGMAIVAETGTGKSYAYQLPLILWILIKKIRVYNEMKTRGQNPSTNCSALLLFPRNVLAYDQLAGIQENLIQHINEIIANHTQIDQLQRNFLKIKIEQDFGGKKNYQERKKMFESTRPDIIVTHVESLKKRLYDPISLSYYEEGIDLVLYDEVHLYEGSYGGYIRGLNARLVNVMAPHRGSNAKPPFFVGMSATIDVPEKHCQKLFSLPKRPVIVDDRNDIKQARTIEHHIMIKPRLGRPPLGVLIDSISCLIHNRRNSLAQNHEHQEASERKRLKSITFINSLDGTSRLTYDLNDFEWFDFPNRHPVQTVKRQYPVFCMPRQNANKGSDICDQCRKGWFVSDCQYYQKGICWYFSHDTAESWHSPHLGTIEYPVDSIRSKRITSQEISKTRTGSDIYKHFVQKRVVSEGRTFRVGEEHGALIDNLVATNTLEVGVDYEGISEVIMYGDIASPASYKQRSGRGAREGNLEDGLVVMTVIQNTPLSNFYFKHFRRLINPQMTPIKLEIRNPNVVKSQCFSSIFDYFAKRQIHLYTVRESQDPDEVKRIIETQYGQALKILETRDGIVSYLRDFLSLMDFHDHSIIAESINEAHSILSKMTKKIPLPQGEKMLIDCISLAAKGDITVRNNLKKIFEGDYKKYNDNMDEIVKVKKELLDMIDEFEKYVNDLPNTPSGFHDTITKIRGLAC